MPVTGKKKQRKDFKIFLWLIIVVCLLIVGRQEYEIHQIRQEDAATRQRIAELQRQKAELEAERKRLDDPQYIEKLAREEYNMVGKDEIPLFIVDEKHDEKPQER